jgi:RNA polymerase sigma factor (sigma-70 family)
VIPCYESPEERIIAARTVEKLARMASLKPRDWRVLRMRYWEEMTFTEIAEREHVSRGRVGQILFRIEWNMRKWAHYSFMRCAS